MDVITYPCDNPCSSMLVKGYPGFLKSVGNMFIHTHTLVRNNAVNHIVYSWSDARAESYFVWYFSGHKQSHPSPHRVNTNNRLL